MRFFRIAGFRAQAALRLRGVGAKPKEESILTVGLIVRVAGSPEPPPAKGCNTREARSCPRWLRATTYKLNRTINRLVVYKGRSLRGPETSFASERASASGGCGPRDRKVAKHIPAILSTLRPFSETVPQPSMRIPLVLRGRPAPGNHGPAWGQTPYSQGSALIRMQR